MIINVDGFQNGYNLSKATGEEWQRLWENKNGKTLICNSEMSKHFKAGILSNPSITINNKIADDIIFINKVI